MFSQIMDSEAQENLRETGKGSRGLFLDTCRPASVLTQESWPWPFMPPSILLSLPLYCSVCQAWSSPFKSKYNDPKGLSILFIVVYWNSVWTIALNSCLSPLEEAEAPSLPGSVTKCPCLCPAPQHCCCRWTVGLFESWVLPLKCLWT